MVEDENILPPFKPYSGGCDPWAWISALSCHPLSAEDVFSHRKWPPALADNDTPVSFIFGGANSRRLYSRLDHVMFLGVIGLSYARLEALMSCKPQWMIPLSPTPGRRTSGRSLHAALAPPMLGELYCIQIPAESRRNSPAVAVGTHRPVLRGIHGDRGKPEP